VVAAQATKKRNLSGAEALRRRFPTFSQEFAFEDSLAAIRTASRFMDRAARVQAIASVLPQASAKTKERLAAKIIQRYFGGRRRADADPHFWKLVLALDDRSTQRELMLYRTAAVDRIVAAISADVFYPRFVAKTYPAGYDESSFRLANTGALFDSDDVITAEFVREFAAKRWAFTSERTVNLSLRILREGGVLCSIASAQATGRSLAYLPASRSISPVTFCYCLASQFRSNDSALPPTLDKVHNADFVKLFLLPRPAVDSLIRESGRRGWLRVEGSGSARQVALVAKGAEELISLLTR
jgi:hypothetical protein